MEAQASKLYRRFVVTKNSKNSNRFKCKTKCSASA